jgi:hypothetical protein
MRKPVAAAAAWVRAAAGSRFRRQRPETVDAWQPRRGRMNWRTTPNGRPLQGSDPPQGGRVDSARHQTQQGIEENTH